MSNVQMSNVERTASLASVLLVDDTPANLLALAAVLKPLGARIVEATSGAEALERLRREPFAVALLDVQMPDMDGFELARRMRASENGRELPILFLTAIHRDEAYVRHGYAIGAADYITKPFDADVLRARVKAFVDLFRQREDVRRAQVELRTRERDEAVRRLVAFERIATAALDTDDLGVLLRELLDVFLGAADAADSAAVLLRYGDELVAQAVVGASEEASRRVSVKIGEGFAGAIAAARHPVELVDAAAPADDSQSKLRARGTRVLYGVPLLHEAEVVGVAHIGSARAGRFCDAEKRLFGAMAERAAWAVARHLKRSRLHDVLTTAPALICIVEGNELRYEFANPAYRALFAGRELVGTRVADTGIDREVVEMLDRVQRTGETVSSDEFPITADFLGTGQRETRFFSFTMQPMRCQSGASAPGVLMFANDVSAHVRARRELLAHQAERAALLERERAARAEAELANQAKDQFLATVSHELRTPLNAILGWTVMTRPDAPPEIERALAIIERNARAQARIIDDVLDISRIVSGKFRLDVTPTNLVEVIQAAVEAVRPAALAHGVELSVSIDQLGHTLGDPERLQQIVWNLLSNGIKFTPSGGQVDLRASLDGPYLVLRVSDTGQGIEPSFLPHLFEAFRQADGSTTRRHGGLGLGLAIVKQLVHAHGGTIRAESEGLGRGSLFTVELPIRSVPVLSGTREQGAGESDIAAPPVRLEGLKVLVVDDEDDARALLQRVLEERGAVVSLAPSSEVALEDFERFRPDVLVSDIGMPGMDGYTLIRSIRTLPPERGGRTPAVALTAYARAEDGHRAFSAGFQRHVPKPVDFGRLVSVIANLGGISFAPP